MFRCLSLLFLLLMVSNCVTSGSTFLGPTIAVARTGNVYQAGLSYGSGKIAHKAKESLRKIKDAKTLVYKQVNQINENIRKNNNNKEILEEKSAFFFKAVKNNLKKYN